MLLNFYRDKECDIILKKLSPNNYLFGSRKIQIKINNGKLLVRVGGGYMAIDEFHELYG